MLLQPTSPLRKYTDIDRACKLILKNKDVDCLVSTTNVNKKTESKKVMYSNGKMLASPKKKILFFLIEKRTINFDNKQKKINDIC